MSLGLQSKLRNIFMSLMCTLSITLILFSSVTLPANALSPIVPAVLIKEKKNCDGIYIKSNGTLGTFRSKWKVWGATNAVGCYKGDSSQVNPKNEQVNVVQCYIKKSVGGNCFPGTVNIPGSGPKQCIQSSTNSTSCP